MQDKDKMELPDEAYKEEKAPESSVSPKKADSSSPDNNSKVGSIPKILAMIVLALTFIMLILHHNRPRAVMSFSFGPSAASREDVGSSYYEEGKYQEAVDYYQEQVDKVIADGDRYDPQNSTLYFNLGLSYYKLEDYENALTYLKECAGVDERIRNTESLAWDYNAIGDVYMDTGNIEEALKYYRKGLKKIQKACGKNSDYAADFLEALARAYKENNEIEKAAECSRQAEDIRGINSTDSSQAPAK